MKVIRDEVWLCTDCTIVACNGDYSGIDSTERVDAINVGFDRLAEKYGDNLVPDNDSETGEGQEEFARRDCACCRSGLAGSFHRFAFLGPDDAEGE
jgi:hypothetical protein